MPTPAILSTHKMPTLATLAICLPEYMINTDLLKPVHKVSAVIQQGRIGAVRRFSRKNEVNNDLCIKFYKKLCNSRLRG